VVLGSEMVAEREWSPGGSGALRVESAGLLAQGGGLLGKSGAAQQILRRYVSVAGSEQRSE
jgi:hypothetical protein